MAFFGSDLYCFGSSTMSQCKHQRGMKKSTGNEYLPEAHDE
jgi:hypothetical protein